MHRLALGGVAGPIIFTAIAILAGELREDYSHVTQFVSELGATGTSRAGLMNYAGFVPGGLGLVAFGVALGRILPRTWLTSTAAVLLTIFGTGVVASGFISCDPGCPQVGGSFENFVHDKIAPVSFLCAIVASALLGIFFRSNPAWRSLSFFSLATSIAAVCFLAGLVSSLESRDLTGMWQRLLLAALFIWCGVIGLQAYLKAAIDRQTA